MMEKKQQQQEKVEDKELYSIWRERKCRAEENKGTLLKVAGIRGRVWLGELQREKLIHLKFLEKIALCLFLIEA